MEIQFWFLRGKGDVGGCGVEERGRNKRLKKEQRGGEKGEEDEGSLVIKSNKGVNLHN